MMLWLLLAALPVSVPLGKLLLMGEALGLGLSGEPTSWSAADVAAWVSCVLGLPQYSASFEANHVEGAALLLLARDDLAALGVDSVGHRIQILRGVAELRGEQLVPGLREATARELRFDHHADELQLDEPGEQQEEQDENVEPSYTPFAPGFAPA